jgi:hypothetical protein
MRIEAEWGGMPAVSALRNPAAAVGLSRISIRRIPGCRARADAPGPMGEFLDLSAAERVVSKAARDLRTT